MLGLSFVWHFWFTFFSWLFRLSHRFGCLSYHKWHCHEKTSFRWISHEIIESHFDDTSINVCGSFFETFSHMIQVEVTSNLFLWHFKAFIDLLNDFRSSTVKSFLCWTSNPYRIPLSFLCFELINQLENNMSNFIRSLIAFETSNTIHFACFSVSFFAI